MADAPNWTVWDVIKWKLWPEKWGGGRPYIQRYKDAWVRYNRLRIFNAAAKYQLPSELIAGVCWIEVGGDPTFIDGIAFAVRSLDWSGPALTDRMTVTRRPETTSFGPVSMQLRAAATTLGLDTSGFGHADWAVLADRLQRDAYNIDIVARHLRQLLAHDGLGRSLPVLSEDEVRIVGARYNRGMSSPLDDIRRHTSYGDLIVKRWRLLQELLK